MRKINAQDIKNTVKEMFMDLNCNIGDDITTALKNGLETEDTDTAKAVLTQLLQNNEIAKSEQVPICQDTGMAILFVEYGDKVIVDGDFNEAVNQGVREAYTQGYLRKSVVMDPVFDRKNTEDNTPAIIHTKIVSGEKLKITAISKGFGSENMSKIKMLSPSASVDGVKDFVLDTVKSAGPNPCPPIVVGVGIGGTFEECALLSKKATARAVDSKNPDARYSNLEDELLEEINTLNIGPAGLKGKTTALKVNIEYTPTHIASIPVAVNICCHACRHKTVEI
ncbi:MAG: fumarate hydratase [Ruminococcaceae bacterium]|nr:fumarate hydratase [Oscillospiraceae bacterium]